MQMAPPGGESPLPNNPEQLYGSVRRRRNALVAPLRPIHDYSSQAETMSQADPAAQRSAVRFYSASRTRLTGLSTGISAPILGSILATCSKCLIVRTKGLGPLFVLVFTL